jgi:hypothetical protein
LLAGFKQLTYGQILCVLFKVVGHVMPHLLRYRLYPRTKYLSGKGTSYQNLSGKDFDTFIILLYAATPNEFRVKEVAFGYVYQQGVSKSNYLGTL